MCDECGGKCDMGLLVWFDLVGMIGCGIQVVEVIFLVDV